MDTTKHSKMAWLWENMRGYRFLYLIGLLGTIVYNVMQLVVPYVTQNLIDVFLTGEDAATNLVTKRDLFWTLIIAMIVPAKKFRNVAKNAHTTVHARTCQN